MGLRDLAESQLACKQQAQAAENAARQAKHVEEAVRLCTDWFLSVLKTKPDSIEVTSTFDNYRGYHCCRVEADGFTFTWTEDHRVFLEHYVRRGTLPEPKPAVAVVEEKPVGTTKQTRWYKVVTEHSYSGSWYATDLPSLALHLQAVDKVIAKRKAAR